MSTVALQSTANREQTSSLAYVFAVLLFIALFLLTVPETTSDTVGYADQIVRYMEGGPPSLIWEFGHLLWRPIGYGLWLLAHPWMSSWSGGRPAVEIIAVLSAVNALAGIALTILVFAICRRLGLRDWSALAVTGGVLLCNPVINYVHSGMAYVPGLTLQMAGLWLILKSFQTPPKATRYAILAGTALALSFCVWFPYILGIPATLLAGRLAKSDHGRGSLQLPPKRNRLLAITVMSATATGATLLLAGTVAGKISSLPVLMQWIINSGHGWQLDRRLLRFPTGLTRSFVHIGDERLMLKQFIFGDPYAAVRWADLFTTIWKILLVFGAFAGLLVGLVRRREGWPALAVAICGILPTFLFGVLVFEPNSPERYLTAYPALIFAVCGLLLLSARFRVTRSALLVFTLALALVNLKAYAWDFRTISASASARARLIRQYAGGHGDITFLLDQDPLDQHFRRFPLARENRPGLLPTYYAFLQGHKSVLTWRHDSACRILQAWNDGGNAWLSTRLLAPRPQLDWKWTEYDDMRVKWADLPGFFNPLATDDQIGNGDGFRRIARTEDNRRLLQSYCSVPMHIEITAQGGGR